MLKRRRFKQSTPLAARLAEDAKRLRVRTKTLPPSPESEDLIRKARQIETASHMHEWLTSPDLRPPT
jgi:hypothetical protein